MKNKLNVYIVSGANDGKTFFPVAEVRAKNKQQADLEFRTSRDLSFYSLRISFKIPMAQAYGLKHYRIDRKK